MSEEKTISDYYGKGGRLKSEAHPVLVETAYRHECSDREVLSPYLHDADLAHAVALIEAGVVPRANGSILLKGLLELDKVEGGMFEVDERLGDLYNSKDKALRRLIGNEAGWLHAGRPRREAINIAFLMACRSRLLDLVEMSASLGTTFADYSVKWSDILMPDFTYLQPAHPTSLGHYILTFGGPIERDLRRFRDCYDELDACPAGSGSTNGTRLPIERHRLAELLGFSRCIPHTRDAMWTPDIPVQVLSALGCSMVNLGRFAEELQLWVSAAFNFVSFDDGFFRSSVIMPHKRNPYAMAYVRGVNGWLSGQLSSALALGKTYTGNPDSRFFLYGMVTESLDKVCGCVSLSLALLNSMQPNETAMNAALNVHFLQATDLAEILMGLGGVDYRSAHQIAGRLSADIAEGKLTVQDITRQKISEVGLLVIGKNVDIPQNSIEEILDFNKLVEARNGYGASKKTRVLEIATELQSDCETGLKWAVKQKKKNRLTAESLRITASQLAKK